MVLGENIQFCIKSKQYHEHGFPRPRVSKALPNQSPTVQKSRSSWQSDTHTRARTHIRIHVQLQCLQHNSLPGRQLACTACMLGPWPGLPLVRQPSPERPVPVGVASVCCALLLVSSLLHCIGGVVLILVTHNPRAKGARCPPASTCPAQEGESG
jgi:hypothetical protein